MSNVKSFSTSHTCSCGVPQSSVFGPLLFVLYTTRLSTLISSLSLNHHLYADDTQLFSFYPSDLESSITHLQIALQQISSWTANLLTLNSFLLTELKQQLANKHLFTSLTQPILPVTMASGNTSPFLTIYQLCLNTATPTSDNFAASYQGVQKNCAIFGPSGITLWVCDSFGLLRTELT